MQRITWKKLTGSNPDQLSYRGKEAPMDKNTEKICRGIYEEIKKEQADLDWFWLRQEAENLMAGKSPSGSIGVSIQEQLKKAGKC